MKHLHETRCVANQQDGLSCDNPPLEYSTQGRSPSKLMCLFLKSEDLFSGLSYKASKATAEPDFICACPLSHTHHALTITAALTLLL